MTRQRKFDAFAIMVVMILTTCFLVYFLPKSKESHDPMINIYLNCTIVAFYLLTGLVFINAALIGWQYKKKDQRKLKFGLDIHGVCDTDPELFSELSKIIVNAEHELHVCTGKHLKDGIKKELKNYGIHYTHLFSIADYHKEKGTPMRYDEKGTPWIDNDLWNRTKGEYCEREQIDLHLDDSSIYGKFFTTSFAHATIKRKK